MNDIKSNTVIIIILITAVLFSVFMNMFYIIDINNKMDDLNQQIEGLFLDSYAGVPLDKIQDHLINIGEKEMGFFSNNVYETLVERGDVDVIKEIEAERLEEGREKLCQLLKAEEIMRDNLMRIAEKKEEVIKKYGL